MPACTKWYSDIILCFVHIHNAGWQTPSTLARALWLRRVLDYLPSFLIAFLHISLFWYGLMLWRLKMNRAIQVVRIANPSKVERSHSSNLLMWPLSQRSLQLSIDVHFHLCIHFYLQVYAYLDGQPLSFQLWGKEPLTFWGKATSVPIARHSFLAQCLCNIEQQWTRWFCWRSRILSANLLILLEHIVMECASFSFWCSECLHCLCFLSFHGSDCLFLCLLDRLSSMAGMGRLEIFNESAKLPA